MHRDAKTISGIVKAPVYQQLNGILRSLIRSGEFRVGEKFPTEREICQRFEVSRATANKALSNLVSEGLLEFRKGVGTFVRRQPMEYNLRSLVSFTEEAAAAGKKPATRVLRFQSMLASEAPAEVSEAMRIAPDASLYYIERLRLADELPVILERRYIAASLCPGLSEGDLSGSIYSLWSSRYNLSVQGADQVIRAVNIQGADARTMDVRQGEAGLLAVSVGYLSGGQPLWFERTLYRGDAYEFHNRLGPIQSAGQNSGRLLKFRESA